MKKSSSDSGWKKKIQEANFIRNIKNLDENILVNFNTGAIEQGIMFRSLAEVLSKDELELYKFERVTIAKFIYNPHKAWVISKDLDGSELFNTYIPPKWKLMAHFKDGKLPASPENPPELFDRYLDHLTDGHLESKEYIYDWLKTALVSKNFTILTAIGEKGIGKGKLGEIMSALFGPSNFRKTRDTVFKKEFNGPLKNRQLVYVDEVAITSKEEADRIKDVVNTKIEIETKGVDSEEADNHASFYITSNRMNAIKIEPNDRRFSIIQLTQNSLLKSLTVPEIEELVSDAQVASLALYLLGRTIKNNMLAPFRSARYDEVLEAGLNEWELYLLEEYFTTPGERFEFSAIKSAIRSKFPFMKGVPGRTRISEFVNKFPSYLKVIRPGKERQVEVVSKYSPTY